MFSGPFKPKRSRSEENAQLKEVHRHREERAREEFFGPNHARHLKSTAWVGFTVVEDENESDAARVAHVLQHDRMEVGNAHVVTAHDATEGKAVHGELSDGLGRVLAEEVQRDLLELLHCVVPVQIRPCSCD